jgi:hypothetical protein
MEFTKTQKTTNTRAFNKAYAEFEAAMVAHDKEFEKALDRNCPIRDRYIAKLKAERDAAIAKANAEYEEQYAIQMAQYEYMMKPAQDANDKARNEAWAKYVAPVINVDIN